MPKLLYLTKKELNSSEEKEDSTNKLIKFICTVFGYDMVSKSHKRHNQKYKPQNKSDQYQEGAVTNVNFLGKFALPKMPTLCTSFEFAKKSEDYEDAKKHSLALDNSHETKLVQNRFAAITDLFRTLFVLHRKIEDKTISPDDISIISPEEEINILLEKSIITTEINLPETNKLESNNETSIFKDYFKIFLSSQDRFINFTNYFNSSALPVAAIPSTIGKLALPIILTRRIYNKAGINLLKNLPKKSRIYIAISMAGGAYGYYYKNNKNDDSLSQENQTRNQADQTKHLYENQENNLLKGKNLELDQSAKVHKEILPTSISSPTDIINRINLLKPKYSFVTPTKLCIAIITVMVTAYAIYNYKFKNKKPIPKDTLIAKITELIANVKKDSNSKKFIQELKCLLNRCSKSQKELAIQLIKADNNISLEIKNLIDNLIK